MVWIIYNYKTINTQLQLPSGKHTKLNTYSCLIFCVQIMRESTPLTRYIGFAPCLPSIMQVHVTNNDYSAR